MDISSLMGAMPGAVAQGLIWGIMAIGVYITFRILDIADLSVDGTMCTGAAVCIMLDQLFRKATSMYVCIRKLNSIILSAIYLKGNNIRYIRDMYVRSITEDLFIIVNNWTT